MLLAPARCSPAGALRSRCSPAGALRAPAGSRFPVPGSPFLLASLAVPGSPFCRACGAAVRGSRQGSRFEVPGSEFVSPDNSKCIGANPERRSSPRRRRGQNVEPGPARRVAPSKNGERGTGNREAHSAEQELGTGNREPRRRRRRSASGASRPYNPAQCLSLQELGSVRTRSSRRSAPAVWVWSTVRAIHD